MKLPSNALGRWVAPGYIGARAFSRTGYPESGFYEPAEVPRRSGSL